MKPDHFPGATFTAIDPGQHTGIAHFVDGRLVAAFQAKDDDLVSVQLGLVVIEVPVYRAHDRVNPNVLITLARRVGRWEARILDAGGTVELVTPSQWKGSVPKRFHQPRILAKLSALEASLLPKTRRTDVVDAVGIGLWRLGR